MDTLLAKHWFHASADEALDLLGSDAQTGLDAAEAEQRLQRLGPNVLTPSRRKSAVRRFLMQFHHPLLYILIAAALIAALFNEFVDAGVIFGVVLINAAIGYIQEARAEKALEALVQTMTTATAVIRSGQTCQIDARELVPGDIVLLQAGDKVPADLRLVASRDLQIDESALTGESVPVEKIWDCPLPPDTSLGDRLNMAYASTLVTYGQGKGLVVATGDRTEVGRISQLIAAVQEVETPLTRKIASFSRLLLYVILALALLAFLVGVGRGEPIPDMFMAAVALAVGAIPEGLPAALTVVLAIGMARMARRRAIVRKLPAVETLGSTTVICSDKTGTLTQHQMTVQQVFAGGQYYTVTGTGYAPDGDILEGGSRAPAAASVALAECLTAGSLCNDSRLVEHEGRWMVQGDPTEGALLVSARKAGLDDAALQQALPRLDTIPFNADHRYMATLHQARDSSSRIAYVKGGVETILDRCSAALGASGERAPLDREQINAAMRTLAGSGMRVLAFARTEWPSDSSQLRAEPLAKDLIFLGLQGLIDPPRPEAIAAVRDCQTAGIQVKMITGDHALTAQAIARQIGLNSAAHTEDGLPVVLTGQQLAALSEQELVERAERTAVYARVSPEQKLRLVQALQARGHVVAMTGDGVNDAPALRQADIGVAMGLMGTDVAKEAADMVLTDDNFASIKAAVEEGRGLFDNMTKIIAWTLPTNFGEGLVILMAILAGVAIPILPLQLLWINMVTVGVLGLVLAVEPREPDVMQRPPRSPQTPILTGPLVLRIALVSLLILVGAFGLFTWERAAGASLAQARTVAANAVVFIEIFYLFNCRTLAHSAFRAGVLTNRWLFAGVAVMVALQLGFTYLPVMQRLFYTAPISLNSWAAIIALGALAFLIVEFEKLGRRWSQTRFTSRVITRDASVP